MQAVELITMTKTTGTKTTGAVLSGAFGLAIFAAFFTATLLLNASPLAAQQQGYSQERLGQEESEQNQPAPPLEQPPETAESDKAAQGPQLPRFVSLKSDKVFVRKGPGRDYDILWTYKSLGLPVEITARHQHWRRIRDSEGAEGWIYFRLLSNLRFALILPWEKTKITAFLRASDNPTARPVARLESGVQIYVRSCTGKWCEVSVKGAGLVGWIEQEKLWGVYPNEIIKR